MTLELQIILIISAILLVLLFIVLSSRTRIVKVYDKYIKVPNSVGLSANQFAGLIINRLGLNVKLGVHDKKLCDAYSPKNRMLIMSKEVCYSASIAALAITAHEVGHALQHHTNNHLFGFQEIWSRLNKFFRVFFWPAILTGIVFLFIDYSIALPILYSAAGIFGFNIIDKLLIIPLESDASKRGLQILIEYNYIDKKEVGIVKKILKIAGQTYIASLFDGIITFGNKLDNMFKK